MTNSTSQPLLGRTIHLLRDFAVTRSSALAWCILAISLAVTAIAWYLSSQYIRDRASDRFLFRVSEMEVSIEQRMLEYEQVLRGGVGLMEASNNVSRAEWRTYFENSRFQEYYPGIQGVGFSRVVKADEKNAFVESIRAEGFPEFDIRPDGERDVYTAIVYLEPFDWRNQRAFGFDMYSEATRRAAMDAAVASGEPTISGVVKLVQETEDDVQQGFLLYLPVFENGETVDEEGQQLASVVGFVYAPFRTRDLMVGIRKSNLPDIDFKIYDGESESTANLLYSSHLPMLRPASEGNADFVLTKQLHLRGRDWTIHFESQPDFISGGESAISLAVAFIGLLVDVLLFLVIGSIGRQQRQAERIAEQMTSEFRKAQKQFQAVCDTAHDPIVLLDQSRCVVYGNPSTIDAFGVSASELIGMPASGLFERSFGSKAASSSTTDDELQCIRKDGTTFPARVSISYWHDGEQQLAAIIVRDVTEQKRVDALIRQQISELSRSNRDLDAFAYVASHDLRSPLRNVKHLADWVLEDTGDQLPTESAKHLHTLKQCIDRMDQLLDDLLQYSRAGRVHDRLTEVNTEELVKKVFGMLAKPALMQVRINGELPTLRTLKTPLETCLRNLVNNAIKHHDREDGIVSVTALENDDWIQFVVEDDGPGIATRFQKKVFEIFRTVAPNSDWKNSSGMGLSIIKKTVETYGGKIELQSELGQGTRFILHWPREIVMPLESVEPPVSAESEG
ncbi:multi-sensor signal transduction histidine kinase [Rhodopirellula baltica SH28]|uniref:histidine kinase n=1 Tax=Rhodopirellula baltica SH28 TaxID=993517 RepID=K5EC38_RHOBT|nr:CHASE domain-containing protein [Rhodopirellula baltica]EKK03431.1 multi-sensor signal transduction histidine kinase [Rhodopirellula baltica SH28]